MYKYFFNSWIVPQLGNLKVQELTPAVFDNWIRKLQAHDLSYNALSSIRMLMRNALNYAVYPAQLIASNPVNYIKIPKNAPKNVIERHIISQERFDALLIKCPFGSPLYIPLLLLYHTGMRIGEVFGLSWQDIDFSAKKINLRRQLIFLAKRGWFFAKLKTESSKRYILIDDFLIGELRRWQAQQVGNEKQYGDSYVYIYHESDGHILQQSKVLPVRKGEIFFPVCTRNDGRLVSKNYATKWLRSEGLNSHSFRHTHATQLIEGGAEPNGVAGRLGHANALITQNIYVHNTQKLQEETLAVFNKNRQTKH